MIPRSIVWQRAEQESSYCNEKVIWLFITKPLPPELQFLFTDILLITLSQADRCPLLCAGRNKRTPFEGVTFERSVSRFGIVSGREPGGCRSRSASPPWMLPRAIFILAAFSAPPAQSALAGSHAQGRRRARSVMARLHFAGAI